MIVITDQERMEEFLRDASNLRGTADEVLVPQSMDELRACVRECAAGGRPFTVAGRGTGLAGGRVPVEETVIATERLNSILQLDVVSKTAFVEPGVLLRDFQEAASEQGLLYPPDPTERLCSLGGTVATNASGARTFRYGPTRSYINSLCVLLPDGEELQLKRGEIYAKGRDLVVYSTGGKRYSAVLPSICMPEIKHAAGYYIKPNMDAIDLFIGSEGTLGVIAEIGIDMLPAPAAILSVFAWFDSVDGMISFVEEARKRSRGQVEGSAIHARAIEVFDRNSLDFIADLLPGLPERAVAAVWFEQETTEETEDAILDEWYRLIGDHSTLADETLMAAGEREREELRAVRHAVSARVYERITAAGQTKIGTDMAVPDRYLRELYATYTREFQATGLPFILYGHIGNNHLHANVFVRGEQERNRAMAAYNACMAFVLGCGGTVSAEHGVGKIKRAYLRQMYGDEAITEFRALKKVFDPYSLLSRNTMFDT